MSKLLSLLAPALLGICLSLTGCTGINPFNWASTDMPCCQHGGCCDSCDSPMMAGEEVEYQGGPLMQSRSHGLLSRGILREHWNLARGFEESGDTEQAAAHYEKILSIQPDYAPAHHRLGVLATMWGRFGAADEHFRLARRTRSPETVTESATEGVTEESYIQENMISEREAEAKIQREIAAERGKTQQVARTNQQIVATRPTRRRYPIGARLVDAYYAQQERKRGSSVVVPPEQAIPQQQIAGKSRTAETMITAKASRSTQSQAASSSNANRNYEKAARTQPRQAVKEYSVENEEQAVEASEVEERSTTQSTRSNSSPQATNRPTASSVRPATRQAPLSRSAELRENTLRPKQEVPATVVAEVSKVAEDSTEAIESETNTESESTATSGIRRISSQEPESFEAEERQYAETIERLSAVRVREKSARADFLEAEVETRVAQELEISLAERRLRLANAQLRLAQQQLNSAIKSAGGEVPAESLEVPSQSHEVPAQAIESLDGTAPQRSSESRDPLPAPRRLKLPQTSAVETKENDFLVETSEESQHAASEEVLEPIEFEAVAGESANSPSATEETNLEQAGANVPAEALGVHTTQLSEETEQAEQEPAILLTSHAEETEPAAFDDSDAAELLEEAPPAEAENAAVRARHAQQRIQHLPDERAHQVEEPIRTLDEQTLRRREVTPRATFAKKAPALPPTVLYR